MKTIRYLLLFFSIFSQLYCLASEKYNRRLIIAVAKENRELHLKIFQRSIVIGALHDQIKNFGGDASSICNDKTLVDVVSNLHEYEATNGSLQYHQWYNKRFKYACSVTEKAIKKVEDLHNDFVKLSLSPEIHVSHEIIK